ncbi:MAG: type III PLP-dependent enzyme [Gammaproteobacteria bacterium]
MNLAHLDLEQIVAHHGSPLLLISRETVADNYHRLQAQLPQVRLYYAVKSNPNADLLRTLVDLGAGFDVASVGELEQVLSLGVGAESIIYTNPIKRFGDIEYLADHGVRSFFCDNALELEKIARACKGADVVLRLGVVNPNCVVDLGVKFGCPPTEAEALLTKALDLGLKPQGLSFHVGSQAFIPQPYVDMLVQCRGIFNRMALEGHPLELLDIGGGFPVSYKTHMLSVESFCKPIREALNAYFPDTRLIAEPGRALSASAAVLLTRVIGKARRQGMTWYYLEDGLYGSFSGCVFDHAQYRFTCLKEGEPEPCVLSGPTCDSFDVITKEEFLPPLDLGDLIIAHDMGAYTTASATTFNGIPVTKAIAID